MELIELEKLSSLINEKLQHWLEAGVKHLPNMVVAIFIAILYLPSSSELSVEQRKTCYEKH